VSLINTIVQMLAPYTNPDYTEIMHQDKQASKADFSLKQ